LIWHSTVFPDYHNSTIMDTIRQLTNKASDVYDTLVFSDSDDFYNKPAPEPLVTFIIGAVLSSYAILLWFWRFQKISRAIDRSQWSPKLALRAMISAAIDNDSPSYTIIKMAAQSFVFLGGIQLNYEMAFIIMLAFFTFESSLDVFRTMLSFFEYKDFDDLVVTSNSMRHQIKKTSTQLSPGSVYEDLSRHQYIVIMVFLTQAVLISFVVVDIFDSATHSCPDGTSGCPVAGTLGSWLFYVLGIFMACVFLLGPKTSFGQSEQNPAFWMQLLLFMKATGSKVSWHDPTVDQPKFRYLSAGDWRVWVRFFMSFVINGVGFHILVHALPIQVAGQSSLTGVVFRAVGMLYLVDLDDTPGYTLTFTDAEDEMAKKVEDSGNDTDEAHEDSPRDADRIPDTLQGEAERIIQEARAKLDALAAGASLTGYGGEGRLINLSGGMALAAAGGVAGASAANKQRSRKENKEKDDGDDAAGEQGAAGEQTA